MACSGSPNQKRRLGISRDEQILDPSAFAASSASNYFPGSMLNFGAVNGLSQQGTSFFDLQETGYDCFDEYLTQPEKKRRLSIDQAQFLEKSFVVDNRLEPERKIQLAKELNLKPRQVAIWFQNRRARWRSKQLETDYEALHASFVSLKNEYDKLVEENERLKSEVLFSKHDGSSSSAADDELAYEAIVATKGDATDVESPQLMDGIRLFRVESGESSRVFDEDELFETFGNYSKTEDGFFEESNDSFHGGLRVEDRSLNLWPY